jgi:apolipoprotein N-acyltransferase
VITGRGRSRWIAPASIAVCVAAMAVWGSARIRSGQLMTEGEPIRVAVLQGNVAQDEKWNPANRAEITDRYLTMTRQALAQGARFIMWPESATPLPLEQDIVGGAAIRRLAVESQATMLVGSDQIEPIKPACPSEK